MKTQRTDYSKEMGTFLQNLVQFLAIQQDYWNERFWNLKKKKSLVRGDTAEGELVMGRDLTELSRNRWERDMENGRGAHIIFKGSLHEGLHSQYL